jgi:hypothetical protein
MSPMLPNEFQRDDQFQREKRDQFLLPFYERIGGWDLIDPELKDSDAHLADTMLWPHRKLCGLHYRGPARIKARALAIETGFLQHIGLALRMLCLASLPHQTMGSASCGLRNARLRRARDQGEFLEEPPVPRNDGRYQPVLAAGSPPAVSLSSCRAAPISGIRNARSG